MLINDKYAISVDEISTADTQTDKKHVIKYISAIGPSEPT